LRTDSPLMVPPCSCTAGTKRSSIEPRPNCALFAAPVGPKPSGQTGRPLLRASAPARIVYLASIGRHPLDFADLMLTRGYTGARA
jgi:hypothetical protein